MKKKIRLWLMRAWRWYRHRQLFVIADPRDNSITMSRGLCDLIDVFNLEETKVFMFKLGNLGNDDEVYGGIVYAFTVNPTIEQETQLCDIQYNSKYKSIGFETLCPTVNRICYDYGLPTHKVKLSIQTKEVNGMRYYILLQPHDKSAS